MNTRNSFGGAQSISVGPTQQLAMAKFMSQTYAWMFVGLSLTAAISYSLSTSDGFVEWLSAHSGFFLLVGLCEFALILGLSFGFNRISSQVATLCFLTYAALNGFMLSAILTAFTPGSVAQTFFITAGMFGGLALYGSLTHRDLTSLGSFVGMGLWGLLLVGFSNLFIRSEALSMGMSAAGVLIFVGLTAYDAQAIRALAYQATFSDSSREKARKGAIFGALKLYLDFVNLFIYLLRLIGRRRN